MLDKLAPVPGKAPSQPGAPSRTSPFAPEPGEVEWYGLHVQQYADNPYDRLNLEDRPAPDPVFAISDFARPVSGYIAPGIHISQRGNGNWLLHVQTGRGVRAYESESREALVAFAKKKRKA